MVLPFARLDSTTMARWWLAMMSKVVHAAEQRRSSMSDDEEEKWERPPPDVPTHGIRSAIPHGMAVTGGVRSPSRHRVWFRARVTGVGD
jgi:hypothetical protein